MRADLAAGRTTSDDDTRETSLSKWLPAASPDGGPGWLAAIRADPGRAGLFARERDDRLRRGLLCARIVGPRVAVALAALALVGFVIVVQPSASVLRAALMGAIALLGVLTHRVGTRCPRWLQRSSR